MVEESPPFITFRRRDVYDQALVLAGEIHRVLERASARFHLKDRLDRASTALVFELSRARAEARSLSWRNYRRAQQLATDCATILDLFEHQGVATKEDLEAVRRLLQDVLAALMRLG